MTIEITYSGELIEGCVSVILVPDTALTEPGYIKAMTAGAEASAKHEFFAMAQMAYYQYQDGELDIVSVTGPVIAKIGDTVEQIDSGMVMYREGNGGLHVLMHEHLNRQKILETTNRYCTRWVRLDI